MRLTGLRGAAAAVVLGALATACGSSASSKSRSACPRPVLTVRSTASNGQPAVSPTAPLTVTGSGFLLCPTSGKGATPDVGIHLFVVQGSNRVSVAGVDASGSTGAFSSTFGIPTTITAGPAQVRAQLTTKPGASALATTELVVGSS